MLPLKILKRALYYHSIKYLGLRDLHAKCVPHARPRNQDEAPFYKTLKTKAKLYESDFELIPHSP